METQGIRLSRRRVLTGLAIFASSTSEAAAQEWWRRGLELFEGLGGGEASSEAKALTAADAALGLQDALKVGFTRVVSRLGQVGGYFEDPDIRIPLPRNLTRVQGALRSVGAAGLLDDVELKLNRAAETAAPLAKPIFFDAIGGMTFDDAIGIVDGPDDSATAYFQEKMSPGLVTAFRPIFERTLDQAGAMQAFDRVSERHAQIPFSDPLGAAAKNSLIDHGLEGGLSGLFHYLGKEEAAIRNNPARRTSEILKRVFG